MASNHDSASDVRTTTGTASPGPSTHWTGKTGLVCGGSQGFGLEIARQLCRERIGHLILVARDEMKLSEAAEKLRREFPAHATISTRVADLCNAASVQALVLQLDELPRLDVVIQAVGMSDRGRVQDLEADRARRLFEVNVISSLHAVRYLPARMARPATLVLIGSLASHFAPRFLGGYAIAKHALAGLAQQSRLELADEQIHVMLASPGPIARADAGLRYLAQAASSDTSRALPADALQPGGGAKVKGLAPEKLAADILRGAARRKPALVFPRKTRLLMILTALSPRLGDWLLRRNSA